MAFMELYTPSPVLMKSRRSPISLVRLNTHPSLKQKSLYMARDGSVDSQLPAPRAARP